MAKATVRLRCSLCNEKFSKLKAYVTYETKRWREKGHKEEKPFFCSRKCGQNYSGVTFNQCRDLKIVASSMRKREAHKNAKLHAWLTKHKVKHRFEYPVGTFIFDLAMRFTDFKVLVEFDSKYHLDNKQVRIDAEKTRTALKYGWTLIRVPQLDSNKIPKKQVRAFVLGAK